MRNVIFYTLAVMAGVFFLSGVAVLAGGSM